MIGNENHLEILKLLQEENYKLNMKNKQLTDDGET